MKRYVVASSISASDPGTDAEVFSEMADSEDWFNRSWVAAHSNTPPEILAKLANDSNYLVRKQVADNLNTPPEILAKLANDDDCIVRWCVASNPNTPPEALAKLANDSNEYTRKCVSENPNTPKEAIAKTNKSKSKRKSSMIAEVKSIDWDDISYEEQFDIENQYLADLETSVLDDMGLWIEPSVQGTQGGVWIYTKEDDETIVDGYDYASYVDSMIEMAIDSDDDEDFKNKYKEFIQDISSDNDLATL